ncbi:MAG: ABC transporter permease [Bacteroidales bacterium]|jgi:ABC-type transport system involved in multi-copper enzyme maturation permease subunit|nr:ABC transporter permease [Bacteroidales bacterium]
MKNFKILLVHELQQQSKSFIFVLMMAVALLTAFICGYIQVDDFAERQAVYREELRTGQAQQKEALAYSQFAVPVLIAPNPMSIFYRGVDESIGNKSMISPVRLPDLESTSQRRNPFLAMFANLDISGIVKILSIFVLLLAAGIIPGERETRIWHLIFANSVKGFAYYLAKFCATGISALLSLSVLFFVAGILAAVHPMVETAGAFWMRLGLTFLASFLYLSVFATLGLAVSARSQHAGASVLWGVLVWIGISFIYPNLIGTLADRPLDAENRLAVREIKNIEEECVREFSSLKKWHGLDMMHLPFARYFDSNIPEQRLLTRSEMEAVISMSEKGVLENELANWERLWPILWKYQQGIQDQKDRMRQKQLGQQRSHQSLTCFLPDMLYEQSLASLAGTGIEYRDEYLRGELRRFRGQVFDYLEGKKAFGEKFFTLFPRDQWRDSWDDYTASEREIYGDFEKQENYPRLSTTDAPVFAFAEKFDFPAGLPVLLGVNVLLFVAGLGWFQKR